MRTIGNYGVCFLMVVACTRTASRTLHAHTLPPVLFSKIFLTATLSHYMYVRPHHPYLYISGNIQSYL
jgi:hypothetical protein